MTETTYENECTTVQEQKCEIQYMTQYEQQCTTQNENVSCLFFGTTLLYFVRYIIIDDRKMKCLTLFQIGMCHCQWTGL